MPWKTPVYQSIEAEVIQRTDELQQKNENELTREERIKKEIIETMVQLAHRSRL